jgi:hypothetical protein
MRVREEERERETYRDKERERQKESRGERETESGRERQREGTETRRAIWTVVSIEHYFLWHLNNNRPLFFLLELV